MFLSLFHQTPTKENNKSMSSGRGSRNFSISSERYIVNQINKSRTRSRNGPLHHHNGSFETEVNHRHTSMETCGTGRVDNERHACIVPQDDDIEKSFRVNQDGSMTVEMKVRLTIKEEEMLHWTTTLSRSSLIKRTVCASISESGNSSPDSNNAIAKDSSSVSEDETKEENRSAGAGAGAGKGVGFNGELAYEGYTSTASGKTKTGSKRTPTPGPRHVRKKASVESVKTVTESGVQESTLGHYSYMERTADGDTTEGYCMVRHSSSSSRPIPKPRKTPSAGASNKGSRSSIRSSGVAEVLQIQNNGMEVTETVMHIYESQGCYDNYLGNEEYSADGVPMHGSASAPESKTSTGRRSSSNDCDIDFSLQPPPTDSVQRQKEEMLSLSSEPLSPTHEATATNSQIQETVRKDKTLKDETKTKIIKPARNQKNSTSTSSSGKKQKESIASPPKNSKHSSTDKLSSNASKKTLSSSESAKSGRKSRGAEKTQNKKISKDEKPPRKEQALLADTENAKTPPKRQNISKTSARYNGHNVNTPTERPQMKKNISDILQPKKSLLPGKKTISKPKSTGNRTPSPKKSLELSESFSMPTINPSPSEIHQYVENWLEKVSPDPVPYTEETITDGSEPPTKVVFQIGADSESDGKNECQNHLDDPSPGDAVKKSPSSLSVPRCHEPSALPHNEQYVRGLCVSMPSVRAEPVHQENRLRPNKSAEAIDPADNESSSSTSNLLDPKAKLKPILRELYSSIHCIRTASEMDATSNLEKSNSLPDFSNQVASVFGSSCKAFMSFLSVMTLRDNLVGSALEENNQSKSPSEAMLMMESLQKLSAIEDEEELRASLTDLQSRASSRFRERWKDFQIMRERLESEPLSPKVSETEFALDVFSEGGDPFEDIDELMDELNMPEDLRAEITSTIQQARTFYPVEESTFVETEKYQSDSEEDVEKFLEECNDETKQSPEPDTTSIAEDIANNNAEIDNLENMQSEHFEQAKMTIESEQEPDKESEKSQVDRDEPLPDKVKEEEEQVEGDNEEVNDQENGNQKKIDDEDGEETETGEREREEEAEEGAEAEVDVKGQGDSEKGNVEEEESEKGNVEVQEVEEGTEKEMTVDEEEEGEKLEEAEEGLMDEDVPEATEGDSVEETDEREGVEETEEEKEGKDEVDEEEQEEETGIEERQGEEIEEEDGVIGETDEVEEVGDILEKVQEEGEEADEVIGETDKGDEVGNIVEEAEEEEEEEADRVTGDTDEGDEVENTMEEVEEEEEEEAADEVTGETDEGGEVGNIIEDAEEEEEEEEADQVSGETDEGDEVGNTMEEVEEEEEDEEETADEVKEETDEGEELGNITEEAEEEEVEGEAADEVTEESGEGEELANIEEAEEEEEEADEDVEEEAEEGIEENNEEEELQEVNKAKDEEEPVQGDEEEEEETDVVTEKDVENAVIEEKDGEDVKEKDEEEDKTEVVSEENNEDEEEREQEVVEDGEDVEGVIRDEAKEGDEGEELERTETSLKEEVGDESEESMKAGQMLEEEEREDGEENEIDEVNEGFDEVEEQETRDEVKNKNAPDDADSIAEDTGCKNLLEEASYLQQQSSCDEVSVDAKEPERNSESSTKYSSEGHCEDDKGNGTDTVNELDTDEGGEPHEGASSSLQHPVEISQELLDFVNSALRSSSLIFTYDTQGNIRIEPDNARVTQSVNPKSKKDNSYGLKRLPSPSTSDLSDYRPETSESGGYKSQDSVDIVTESGEEASPVCRRKTDGRTNVERANSNLSVANKTEVLQISQLKGGDSFSSCDSGTKASKEDLSYFSAGSSQKADAEPATEATLCTSFSPKKDPADGVLIDQGRWLLKENHLIRKSPPVSLGMYGQLDSTSIDTGQENSSEDSLSHCKIQQNPLAAISSSELEEMAKPQTPKCTYYNMPHGSDSDPFLDDSSLKSGKKGASRRGIRVSPTIDTSKTWASKNGSLSSFASVEFKIPDRKVHPEGESTAVTRPRRTSSGAGSVLQAQDSLDTLHVRCGQYCPIL